MRYIHLYFSYMKRSLISRMEYKKDTFVAMLGFFFENAASLASLYLVISAIPSLDGWSIWQIGFLYGFAMIPRGLDHMFTDDLWLVAYRKVKMGMLDQNFLRPLPVLFQVIAETFQPDAFGELIIGVVMTVACGIVTHVNITFSMALLLIVASIFGALIITSLKIALASLAFIFKSSGRLLQIIYNFMDYAKYPISIFPKIIRNALIFAIPFGLCISVPVADLYGKVGYTYNPYLLMLWIMATAVVFLALSITIWHFCEKRYESTGN